MKLHKLVLIPFAALLLSSCLPGGGGGGGGGDYPEDQVKKDSYYNTSEYRLNDLTGMPLQIEIHRLMLDTHKTLVKYAQFTQYDKTTSDRKYSVDQVNASTQKNEYFYTGKQNPFNTSISREHVWPCAKSGGMWVHKNYSDIKYYVDGTNYAGGGSDLYHVRPSTGNVNTARGDSRFKEFTDAEKQSGNLYQIGDGGPYKLICDKEEFSNYAEPADEFKGDIARILVYVYIHYATLGSYNWKDYCGTLSLRDVMGYSTDQEVYETLVKWNELDKPSETEKLRNDTVQGIQGNRNPFVDYPFLMRACFNL